MILAARIVDVEYEQIRVPIRVDIGNGDGGALILCSEPTRNRPDLAPAPDRIAGRMSNYVRIR